MLTLTKFKVFADDKIFFLKFLYLIESKTLCEKEKMLIVNIFFFFLSHYDFKNSSRRQIYLTKMMIPVFDRVKTLWEKKKVIITRIFSFFPQCFLKPSSSGSLKLGIV